MFFFCPKQGQGFKPSAAALDPNMGQVYEVKSRTGKIFQSPRRRYPSFRFVSLGVVRFDDFPDRLVGFKDRLVNFRHRLINRLLKFPDRLVHFQVLFVYFRDRLVDI